MKIKEAIEKLKQKDPEIVVRVITVAHVIKQLEYLVDIGYATPDTEIFSGSIDEFTKGLGEYLDQLAIKQC